MNWDMGNYISVSGRPSFGSRMDRARAEVIRSITGLSDNFEFNIIGYNCSTLQWSSNMQEATEQTNTIKAGIARGRNMAHLQETGNPEPVVTLTHQRGHKDRYKGIRAHPGKKMRVAYWTAPGIPETMA